MSSVPATNDVQVVPLVDVSNSMSDGVPDFKNYIREPVEVVAVKHNPQYSLLGDVLFPTSAFLNATIMILPPMVHPLQEMCLAQSR